MAAPVSIRPLVADRQSIRDGHVERRGTNWHPTQRSKEDIPQDKESQRATYRQHGPDQLRSATQLLPVYASSALALLSWLL
jgi:hypothetical protein